MQEGGAKMVKLESGAGQTEIVEFLASHDIAVCAHLGLKPQSVHKSGGFRVQGRDNEAAERMLHDAKKLAEAGADMLLLECIPTELGQAVTEAVHVPVIGIGAGPHTDGQILVLYDGSQAALRQEFHAGRRHESAGAQELRGRREEGRIPGGRTLLLSTPR